MTDPTTARSVGTPPLKPLVDHPGLVAGTAIAGLALGLVAGALTPTTYTAQARLSVGSGELSNLTIPGYPTASRDLASNYARWVTNQGAGGELIGDDSVELSASPIPESNVILLEAESTDEDKATSAADRATEALTDEINKTRENDDPATVLEQISAKAPELADAEQQRIVASDLYRRQLTQVSEGQLAEGSVAPAREDFLAKSTRFETLQAELDGLRSRYQRLVSQQTDEADLSVIQPAEIVGDTRAGNLQRFGLVGAVLGAVLGFVLAHLLHRRRRQGASTASTTGTRVRRPRRAAAAEDGATSTARRADAPGAGSTEIDERPGH